MYKFVILSKAIDFIEDNINNSFTRADIANHCYVSLSYLEKIFKYAFDRGIKDYILKRRMTEAAKDLVINNMSVTDVAMKYQYNAIESFSRAFKSVWNINPSSYKKNGKFTNLFLKIGIDYNNPDLTYKQVDISKLYNLLSNLKDTYILCFDGMNFSQYNKVSMKCGDRAIIEIANRIDEYAVDNMFTIRIGGDEFALVTGLYDYNEAMSIANLVLSENGNVFEYEGIKYPLSLWCGISKLDESLKYNQLFDNMQNVIDNSKEK